jgi:N-acetylmuramoyl-L-alanine amidase
MMRCRSIAQENRSERGRTRVPCSRPRPEEGRGSCFSGNRGVLRWGFLLLLVGLSLSPEVSAASGKASLKKIRYWVTPGYARVVLDLDRTVKYEVGRVEEDPASQRPERIFVDLFQTSCARDLPRKIELAQGPVRWIRASPYDARKGRLVLDLRRVEHYKVFQLDRPDRIVIDLWQAGAQPDENVGEVQKKEDVVTREERNAVRLPLIVLDPGHGGTDPGAIGKSGLQEKYVVYSIARELKRLLEKRGIANVVLTRNGDFFLSLKERTRLANARGADLFVSIHANASPRRQVRGIETYYLDNTTDRASIRLAAMENRSAGEQVDDLECILRDLRLSSNANESNLLAQTIQKSTVKSLGKKYRGVDDLGAKGNLFYVLLGAHMPSVLVEVSFLSNPDEEKRLKDPAYRNDIAQGISAGIEKYLDQPATYRLAAGSSAGLL